MWKIIESCWHKNPSIRPSALEFIDDIIMVKSELYRDLHSRDTIPTSESHPNYAMKLSGLERSPSGVSRFKYLETSQMES
jgi:hypothetical protein